MLYLVAVLFPPLAVFLAGKPFQGLINVLLTLCFYFPGLIHALSVVHNKYADGRTGRVIKAQEKSAQAQVAAMQEMTNQQLTAMRMQIELQAAQIQATQAAQMLAAQMAQSAQPQFPVAQLANSTSTAIPGWYSGSNR